jgi:hypothetical protein
MTTRATKNPIPDSHAYRGLTWALLPLVVSGSVTGAGGSRPPIAAMVVEVVEVEGAVGAGTRGRTDPGLGRRGTVPGTVVPGELTVGVVLEVGGAVEGGAVEGGGAGVVGGLVDGGEVDGEVVTLAVGWVRPGNAAAADPAPAATRATEVRRARPEKATTVLTTSPGRRLTPTVWRLPVPECRTGRCALTGTGGAGG